MAVVQKLKKKIIRLGWLRLRLIIVVINCAYQAI
jgi:hypothetical protein